jgi:hypothetical protein
MAGTAGAFAPWLATVFVTLDQRAAQDRLEWRQLALEGLTAAGSFFVANSKSESAPLWWRTERRIGPVCPFARNAEAAAIQLPE